ncbi:hypothetical protein DFH11DRAFT_1330531 [Phellopilus nigrolimitatus]|nr:hypothetical protein DFH11DRAFT_1330531 [Phellopilus nigrolimitatus]
MDEKNACATTTSRCLALPEIIYEVASYLHKSQDLLSTSSCCRIWYETLIPLRSKLSCVLLRDITSFRDFLSSNERAAHHCRALRILSEAEEDVDDDDDDEEDRDEEEDNNNDTDDQKDQPANVIDMSAIRDILHLLSNNEGLKLFMYAVPGETCTPLLEDIWIALRKLSSSLEGLYVELRAYNNWHTFLTSQYSNLRYLHLFLGIDDRLSLSDTSPNPTITLIAFLHQHKNLQNLHLYLGSQFDEMDLSELYFPNLQSFLLAGDAKVRQFIVKHTTLQHLSVHADSDVKPLTEHDLPNLLSLQVNHLTLPWFQNMLAASSSSRKQPIRNLCVMNPELDLNNVEHIIAPLGRQLCCLELNFGYPNERLISVLEYVSRMFPELVELSLEVSSCVISDEDSAAAVSMVCTQLLAPFWILIVFGLRVQFWNVSQRATTYWPSLFQAMKRRFSEKTSTRF